MKILIIATESYPYCKTGGLADVVFGLARQLNRQDDARIVIPAYRGVLDQSKMRRIAASIEIPLWTYYRPAWVWTPAMTDAPRFYFVENEFYFERENYYGYVDDYERFIFFCRSALRMLKDDAFQREENGWFPDIIHGFNAVTGLIPGWLAQEARDENHPDPRFDQARFVLSLHNLSHVGRYNTRALQVALQEETGYYEEFENNWQINLLGRAVCSADKIVLANPTDYDRPSLLGQSAGIVQAFEQRKPNDLVIIPNGIDYLIYDPSKDPALLPQDRFSDEQPENRKNNKARLQHDLGFESNPAIPLMGMVSRVREDRGFELLRGLNELLRKAERRSQLVILTEDDSDEILLKQLDAWALAWKEEGGWLHMEIIRDHDDARARLIYAGCDLILMPFRQIPSGTQQLIAMRYGAVPLVFEAGALKDSVKDVDETNFGAAGLDDHQGLGFTFREYTDKAFQETLLRALKHYGSEGWKRIQDQNMSQNFRWREPAREYTRLYAAARSQNRRIIARGQTLQINRDAQLMQAILEIDGLPGMASRDPRQMLRQAARLVRWLTGAEAVYTWLLAENLPPRPKNATTSIFDFWPEMELVDSLATHGTNDEKEKEQAARFLHEQGVGVWKKFSDSEMGGLCRPIRGVEESELCKVRGWSEGRSVTITTHSRVLGRIDVLFRETIPTEDESWYSAALTTLASSFGQRLESIRYAHEKDEAVAMSTDISGAGGRVETAQKVLARARAICKASAAWIYLTNDGVLSPVGETPPDAVRELAELALSERDTIYQRDWAANLNGRQRETGFRSFLAFPLGSGKDVLEGRSIGVVVVANTNPGAFSLNQEHTLKSTLAPLAAKVLEASLTREAEDHQRLMKLTGLAESLVGGVEFDKLLANSLQAIAGALQAEAASLFLIEESDPAQLRLRATFGYHNQLQEPQLEVPGEEGALKPAGDVIYQLIHEPPEGITAFIAQTGNAVKFDNSEEMHRHPSWRGKFISRQNKREPNAFIGFPLRISSHEPGGNPIVIGVLKLEDRCKGAAPQFSEEDFRLGGMMANMMATVVHNTRLTDARLRDMNANLQRLSAAMTLSQDQTTMFQSIIVSIMGILGAEAASLYLLDDDKRTLRIRAGEGYHRDLLIKGKTYDITGEGVTAAIAREKKTVNCKTLDDLHREPNWAGLNNDAQGGTEPNAFLGIPLLIKQPDGTEDILGVLKVENIKKSKKHPEEHFTSQDEALVQMMGSAMAAVIKNTSAVDMRLNSLTETLGRLSSDMTGGMVQKILFQRIIDTITSLMGAEASSLYLLEDDKKTLRIMAASGYHKKLMEHGKTYSLQSEKGERIGVTAAIARDKKPFRANNLQALQAHPEWVGKNNPAQDGQEPNAFLGVPLMISEENREARVIGVLKVEDIRATPNHPETVFTDQDEALVLMMASAITAVIENTRLADQRLLDMTANLRLLSNAMTGGTGQTTLVQRVVDAITTIMRAMAASLYLLEPDRRTLRIRAASGYQTGLMVNGKTYDVFGKGVTSSIARNNKEVIANNLAALHDHPDWAGTNNPVQDGREPNAFLGIPLTVQVKDEEPQVIGVLKVEDIQPGPGHPDNYFTDQDVVLVKMMGAIIAATLHNTRQSDARLANVLIEATRGSMPLRSESTALATWSALLSLNDRAIYEAFTTVFFQTIQPVDWYLLAEQTRLLLAMNLSDDFYQTMSTMAPEGICQRWFNTLARYSNLPSARRTHVLQALMIDREWQEFMHAEPGTREDRSLVQLFPSFMKGSRFEIGGIKRYRMLRVFELTGALPPTMSSRLEKIPQKLPLLFFNGPDWDWDTAQQDLKEYLPVAQAQFGKNSKILLLSLAMPEAAARQAENDLRPLFAARFIDVLPMGLHEIQEYIVSRDPKQELLARLLRTVNLELISPYQGEGSTRNNMFFGREKILQEITTSISHASFCLVGGRKMGKTSIMKRLHNLTLGPAGYHSAYFDLMKHKTIDELLAQPVGDWQPNPPENAPYTLGELLATARKGQNIVLLLDEFDKIIDEDEKNNWAFLYRLRSLNFEEKIRFVLGGEMRLNLLSKEGGDALYNFTTRLLIKPLDDNEVHQLVTQPMQEMQIGLNDPEKITQAIFEFSAGHPAVVQYTCRRLIILLNQNRSRPRTIHMDDVEAVFKQTDFQQDEFLKLYWERASTIEKIISMVMVEHDEASFGLDDVQERIKNQTRLSIADNIVAEALTALTEIRSIFKFDGGRYSYAVPAFRKILTNNDLRLLLLRSAIAEFHNGKL